MTQIITSKWWGWWWKIDKYVVDAPYECWDWEDRAIAWDAVYTKVSAMECVLNTALQPNDNVSELYNDAWYIDSSALAWYALACDIPTDNCQLANWCGYAKASSLCTVATTWKYCDLTWQPTIWNATLTIQRNGTCVNSITMNATSNVTANISVPTKTSDISNDCWYINKDVANLTNYTPSTNLCAVATSGKYCDLSWTPDLSGYQTKNCMVCSLSWADDSHYPTAKTVADALSCAGAGDMMKSVYDPNNCNADAFNYNNFYNKPAIIDNLCCTSCTDALSANQGKALKDLIDTYVGLWRFLSLWDAATGQPISFPLTTPYTYKTWDWYMVEVTGATNYMPNGSSYSWTASTTVDSTNNVEVRDVYIYDGTDWLFQKNNEVQVSFADIAWVPADNSCLSAALNDKQDNLTAGRNIAITSNTVKATNIYNITEADSCTTYTGTLWVAPYNTSYCYTNICIDPATWIEWKEGSIYSFDINTEMVATSACRNVRVKIGSWEYIPVMWTSSILAWCAYFTKANIRQYMYSTKYQSWWALHLFTDSNTTYSAMWCAEINTWTCTSARSITAACLKYAIQYYSPTDNSQLANGCGYVTASVNNLSNYTLSSCLCAVATSWEYCDLANVPTIPTCVSQLSNDSWYISWITCGDVTSALWYTPYDSNNPSWYTTCTWTLTASNISDTAFGASWDWDTTNAPSKNAIYDVLWDVETLLANL